MLLICDCHSAPPSASLILKFLEICSAQRIDGKLQIAPTCSVLQMFLLLGLCLTQARACDAGNMLFQVEALLESLSDAGTAVDLATQSAFKELRTRTLKQQREAFATQAGKGSAQKKIAWEDVSRRSCSVPPCVLSANAVDVIPIIFLPCAGRCKEQCRQRIVSATRCNY